MHITIDFLADFETYIRGVLANRGFKHVSGDRAVLFAQYCNLLNRRIAQHKRRIEKSGVFECPKKYRPGQMKLEAAISRGENLLAWQSKNILNADYTDAMLDQSKIHHLHLGETKEDDSVFMERTGFVLYCIIDIQTVYFIQVMPHGERNIQELISIVRTNWPELYVAKNQTNEAKTFDVNQSDPALQLENMLHGYEDVIRENEEKYFKQVKRLSKVEPDSLEFNMVIDEKTGMAYAEESESKMRVKLGLI